MKQKFRVLQYGMTSNLETQLNKAYNEGYEPVYFSDTMVVLKHTGVTEIL